MGLQLLQKPVKEPVTLDEVLAHCRVTSDDENGLVQGYAVAARALVENDTRRALITQRWRYTLDDGWPTFRDIWSHQPSGAFRKRITLPKPPLQTVEIITYVSTDGTTATLDVSQYRVYKADTGEWRVDPAPGSTWPQLQVGCPASVTIDFTAGYGDEPGDVDEVLRHAILMQVSQWFDYRVSIVEARSVTELSEGPRALIQRGWVGYG